MHAKHNLVTHEQSPSSEFGIEKSNSTILQHHLYWNELAILTLLVAIEAPVVIATYFA